MGIKGTALANLQTRKTVMIYLFKNLLFRAAGGRAAEPHEYISLINSIFSQKNASSGAMRRGTQPFDGVTLQKNPSECQTVKSRTKKLLIIPLNGKITTRF